MEQHNEDSKVKGYRAVLAAFMSHQDGYTYMRTHQFEDNALVQVTPEEICRWLNEKAYRVEEPGEQDRPTSARLSLLMFYKKSISYFMPLKMESWNVRSKQGNPTRSVAVNNLIAKVKKREVRKQGAVSQARRALQAREYESIIAVLWQSEDPTKRYLQPAFHAFQYNLIARLDDTAHVKLENIKPHADFDFVLVAQV